MFPIRPYCFRIAVSELCRNKFNSEKVLDVTYASRFIHFAHENPRSSLNPCPLDIQGIDQLVEKFRNSSVMDQDPSYRPKVCVVLAGCDKI